VLLLKRQHVQENEMLLLKRQKEVQHQGEERVLAALRERPLRESRLSERPLRERPPLRDEEGNQSFTLINLFLFF
jgi:hypothetical protein